jgi:hypothetical protein
MTAPITQAASAAQTMLSSTAAFARLKPAVRDCWVSQHGRPCRFARTCLLKPSHAERSPTLP